jgi:hypothetical protein
MFRTGCQFFLIVLQDWSGDLQRLLQAYSSVDSFYICINHRTNAGGVLPSAEGHFIYWCAVFRAARRKPHTEDRQGACCRRQNTLY